MGRQLAAVHYSLFLDKQRRLNAEFGGHRLYVAKLLRKHRAAIKANEDAMVVAALAWYNQLHTHLERIRAGEFKKYGITTPTVSELADEAGAGTR